MIELRTLLLIAGILALFGPILVVTTGLAVTAWASRHRRRVVARDARLFGDWISGLFINPTQPIVAPIRHDHRRAR